MRIKYDIAYGCFLVVGLAYLAAVIGIALHLDFDSGFTGQFFYWSYWVGAIAWLVGFIYALKLWRHAPLAVLAVLTVLVGGVSMLEDVVAAVTSQLITVIGGLFGLTASTLSLRWFLVARGRFA